MGVAILANGPQKAMAGFIRLTGEAQSDYETKLGSRFSLRDIPSQTDSKKLSDIYKSKVHQANKGRLHKGAESRVPQCLGGNIHSGALGLECGGLRKQAPELARKNIDKMIECSSARLTDLELAERMTQLVQDDTQPLSLDDLKNPENIRRSMGEDRVLRSITRMTGRMSQAAGQITAANNRLEELAYKPFREWKPLAKLVSFIPRQIRRQLVYGVANLVYCGVLATISFFMSPIAHVVITPAFLAACISAIATLTGSAYTIYARLSVSGFFKIPGKADKLIDLLEYDSVTKELRFKESDPNATGERKKLLPSDQQKLVFARYKNQLQELINKNQNAGHRVLKRELARAMKKDLCTLFHGYRDAQLYKANRAVFEHLKPDNLEQTDATDLAKNAKSKAYRKTGATFYNYINRQYAKDETQRCIDELMLSVAKGDDSAELFRKVEEFRYVPMTGTYGKKSLTLIQAMDVLGYADSEIQTVQNIQEYALNNYINPSMRASTEHIKRSDSTRPRYSHYTAFIDKELSSSLLLKKYSISDADDTFEQELNKLKSFVNPDKDLDVKTENELLRTLKILEDTTLLMPEDYVHPSAGENDKGKLRTRLIELKNTISDVLVWNNLNKINEDENLAGYISPKLHESDHIKQKYVETAHEALKRKKGHAPETDDAFKKRLEKNAYMLLAHTNYANRGDEVNITQKNQQVAFRYKTPGRTVWESGKLTLPESMVMSKMIVQALGPALAFRDQTFVPNHLSMTDLRQFNPRMSTGSASVFNKLATGSGKVADTLEAIAITADNSVEMFKQLSSTLLSLLRLKKLSKDDVLLNAFGNMGSWWISSRVGVKSHLGNNIELFTLGSLVVPIRLVASAINGSSRVLSTLPRLLEVAFMAAAKSQVREQYKEAQLNAWSKTRLRERNHMEDMRLEMRRLGLQRGAHDSTHVIARIKKTETHESPSRISQRIANASAGYLAVFEPSKLDLNTIPFISSYQAATR